MLNEQEIGKIFYKFESKIRQLIDNSGPNVKVLSVYDCCRLAYEGEKKAAEKALKSYKTKVE